jgi:hypothetical protein
MAVKPRPSVPQQVRRARRRLFLQGLLDCLASCWTAALALASAWFLAQRLLTGEVDETLRWAGAGGLTVAATLLAFLLAIRRVPRPTDVALAVDQRCGLAERVTTFLSLTPAEMHSPAGLALSADVAERVAALDIRSRFPVRLSWRAALVPVGAAALALVAFFCELPPGVASGDSDKDRQQAAAALDIEQKVQELRKKGLKKDRPPDASRDKELEDAWNKLLDKQIDLNDKEKVREQTRAMRSLEEKIRDRAQDLRPQVEKSQALARELRKLDPLDPTGKKLDPKEGPAREAMEALAKGDLDKAQEALEKLEKKLRQGKLDKQQTQQLQQQLEDLQPRLQQLASQEDLKRELQRLRDEGQLDDRELQQALERLEQEGESAPDLKELARMLEDVQDALKKGRKSMAAGKLKRIAGKLEKMKRTEDELRDLDENAQQLEEVREAMLLRLNGGSGPIGGGPPGGRRPLGKDQKTGPKDARQRAEMDPTGRLRIAGFSRGGSFSRIPAREVQGAFRRAEQEAPEALERQRISPEEAEMLKGYYENLGKQR